MTFHHAIMVVFLVCFHTAQCTHGDLKLVRGNTTNDGQLQMCFWGLWTLVENFGDNEGATACRQLGLLEYTSEYYIHVAFDTIVGAVSGTKVWLYSSFVCVCVCVCVHQYSTTECSRAALSLTQGSVASHEILEGRRNSCTVYWTPTLRALHLLLW